MTAAGLRTTHQQVRRGKCQMPKVSVVMSVYNGERHLREAVDSILNQTFGDLEFIIVDDGSRDRTWEILQSYDDSRIVLLRNEQNIGLTKSLNRGLAATRGEYVARMDADDVSLPQRLERQVGFLDQHPEIGLVGCAFLQINEGGQEFEIFHPPLKNEDIQERLRVENCFCHGVALFRHRCLE